MSGKGIRIEGLRKRYGEGDTAVDALKGVDMQVCAGRGRRPDRSFRFRQEHVAQMPGRGDRSDRRPHDPRR